MPGETWGGGRISPSSSAATCCNESNLNVWETMEEALDKPAAIYIFPHARRSMLERIGAGEGRRLVQAGDGVAAEARGEGEGA
mgnify:CR=1 FL=1